MSTPLEGLEGLVRQIVEQFPSRVSDPVAFARRTRMVLVQATNGCDVDISPSACLATRRRFPTGRGL